MELTGLSQECDRGHYLFSRVLLVASPDLALLMCKTKHKDALCSLEA